MRTSAAAAMVAVSLGIADEQPAETAAGAPLFPATRGESCEGDQRSAEQHAGGLGNGGG